MLYYAYASFLIIDYQVDVQALAHAVELTRQGAVDSLKFAKGDLYQAFQVSLQNIIEYKLFSYGYGYLLPFPFQIPPKRATCFQSFVCVKVALFDKVFALSNGIVF